MSEPDQPETGDLKRLVVVRMPFGKYKGRLIADLPGAYLKGLITFSTWPARRTRRLLAPMPEVDHNGLERLLDPLRERFIRPACRPPPR